MMTKSEIYYFAGKCLVLDENFKFRKEIIELSKNNLIDWEIFVEICSNNYVLPSIFLKFKTHNILKYLPQELSEHLFNIYDLNQTRNIAILEQIKSITSLLNSENIYPIFLKGSGNLINGLYSDIGERLMIDIDFLVPEMDFLKSAEIMLNNGYLSYTNDEILEVWKWKHYPPLYHPDHPASIEIHRIPTHHKRNWFNHRIINSEKKSVNSINGCYVPASHHMIIHNFIHSQLSHKGYLFGNVLLRDIYDIYLLSKKNSLSKTLSQIKERSKAIAYFAFTRTVFELDEHFFPYQNFNYRILKKKHKSILNSRLFRKLYSGIVSTFLILKDRYLRKFMMLFYSKEIRRSLKRKLNIWQP